MAAPSALTGRELSALSQYELGAMLNEIDEQDGIFSQIAVDAEKALGQAESMLIRNPDDRETKALARQIRGNLNAAKLQLSALKRKQSRIQSMLRSMGPVPV